jgi:hypothetical protein
MTSGVRVVGGDGRPGTVTDDVVEEAAPADEAGDGVVRDESPDETGMHGEREPEEGEVHADRGRAKRARRDRSARRRRRRVGALAVVAVLGVAGTVGFGMAWAGLHAQQSGEAQASRAARSFLVDLTNFDAKTVDADFSAVTSMATGPFASQAQRFFNSTIRQDLERALASSRGQVRALYVQSYGSGEATVYGVVDQLYVNAKLSSPQTDVLRVVVNLTQVRGTWKVADVTVLQGPSLAGTSTHPAG